MKTDSHFTFRCYEQILELISAKRLKFAVFADGPSKAKRAYLRHDIDVSISAALPVAQLEFRHGIRSTFFVMCNTEIYNVYASVNRTIICKLLELGHDVGLHFVPDPEASRVHVEPQITREAKLLSMLINHQVRTFSIHRPSVWILNSELRPAGLVNTYAPEFFALDSYISDSNRNWRCGDPLEFIRNHRARLLQVTTHPIWWSEAPCSALERLEMFLQSEHAVCARQYLCANIKVAAAAWQHIPMPPTVADK